MNKGAYVILAIAVGREVADVAEAAHASPLIGTFGWHAPLEHTDSPMLSLDDKSDDSGAEPDFASPPYDPGQDLPPQSELMQFFDHNEDDDDSSWWTSNASRGANMALLGVV